MRRSVNSPYRITLKYGATSSPYSASNPHKGTDYAHGIPGVKQAVYAPEAGEVRHGTDKSCGTFIRLYVGGKHKHTFCHLSKREVGSGVVVKEGQRIGTTGSTGYATGVHLHHVYYPNGDGKHSDYEKLLKEQEKEMVTKRGLDVIYRLRLGRKPTSYAIKNLLGKVSFDEADNRVMGSQAYKDVLGKAQGGTLDPVVHLPGAVREVYKAPTTEVVEKIVEKEVVIEQFPNWIPLWLKGILEKIFKKEK